jgi:hypothetical protein
MGCGFLTFDKDPIYDVEGGSKKKGLSCCLQRIVIHALMIHMLGIQVMI